NREARVTGLNLPAQGGGARGRRKGPRSGHWLLLQRNLQPASLPFRCAHSAVLACFCREFAGIAAPPARCGVAATKPYNMGTNQEPVKGPPPPPTPCARA